MEEPLETFDLKNANDADAFLEMYHSSIFRYWLDLITRMFDLAVSDLVTMNVKKMSVEDLGKSMVFLCAKRDAYQSLILFVEEKKEEAEQILNEGSKK